MNLMDINLKKIVQALQKDFDVTSGVPGGGACLRPAGTNRRGDHILRDTHEFELLSALTAVDYWPQQEPRFHVIYQFDVASKEPVDPVTVPVAATRPVVPTVTGVFASGKLARAGSLGHVRHPLRWPS